MTVGWHDLAPPRRPSAAEQTLIDLLAARTGIPELAAQAETVMVTGTCTCGCASIRLDGDGPVAPPAALARLTTRDDVLRIDATRYDTDGERMVEMRQVILTVLGGRLYELEVFVEEGVALAIPTPDELGPIEFM